MAIQQLTQPILNPIVAFDATQVQAITFVVIGGAQVIGNRLVISDNQTGAEVYNQLQSTMKLEHLVPANTLANGGYYNAVVYTIDSGNNESEASTAIPFYCYSQPSLTIDNIPATETIENGTYKFTGNYLQQENELLNSYQYTLYDSNRDILSQSPLIYYNTDPTLSYTFVGMSNDTSYYIELSGETINGTKITSGLRYFTVRYIQPASFAICDLVNNCENGYIQISSNIVAIDGKSNPDPPIYIDDKEVDLRDPDSWVEWNSGFRIQDDFTMRVWGRDFNDYQNIITLTNDINTTATPNRIELKWMVGDVIKTLPSYTTVKGNNINILNAEAAKIQNLSVGGSLEQKIEDEIDFGTDKFLTINTDKELPLQVNILGNSEQKTYSGKNILNFGATRNATQSGVTYSYDANTQIWTLNGTATAKIDVNFYFGVPVKTDTNKVYQLESFYVNGSISNDICKIYMQDANQGYNGWGVQLLNADTRQPSTKTVALSMGLLIFRIESGTVLNNYQFKAQFEQTDNPTVVEWEPYVGGIPAPNPVYPSEIKTVNNSVKITKCNKNIAKEVEYTEQLTKYRRIIYATYTLIKGKTYYFSFDTDNSGLQVYRQIPSSLGLENVSEYSFTCDGKRKSFYGIATESKTITTEVINRLSDSSNTTITLSNFMISTDENIIYEPHQEQSYILPIQQEMLQGDLFTQKPNKKEIHHWNKIILDGTENIGYYGKYGEHQLFYYDALSDSDYKNYTSIITISNQYKSVADTNNVANAMKNYEMRVRRGDGRLYWQDDRFDNAEDMKKWIQENNIVVYYKLATPTSVNCTEEQNAILNELNSSESYYPQTNIYTDNNIALLNAKKPGSLSSIYSVGETKNLINIENFNANYTQQYFQTTNTRFLLKSNFIYTFSFDYSVKATTTDLYYSIGYGTDSYDTDLKSTVQYQTLVKGRNFVSFIVPDSIPSNSYLWVKFAQTIILADVSVDISNIQLEAGNVITDYEDPGLYNIYPTSAANNLFNYDTPIYLLKNNINYVAIQNGYHISPVEINKEAYLGIGFKNILKPGNTYTLSFSQLGQFEEFALYTTNKESEETIAEIPITNNVFVAPEGIYDLQLVFAVDNSSLSNYIEIWNVQIEANNVISEYEPYVSNSSIITLDEPLRGIGEYKDLICLESPNILNQDTQSGVVTGNTIYYLNQTGNTEYYIWYYNEDGNLITFIDEEGYEGSGTKGVTGSFVTHKDCVKITITKSDNPKAGDVTSSELTTNHVGITKGINPQVYYPYISEPSIIRYIKGRVLDGKEPWVKGSDKEGFYINTNSFKELSNSPIISNKFVGYQNYHDYALVNNAIGWIYTNIHQLYIKIEGISTVDDLKTWLSNNNVDMYYVLDTPTVSKLSDNNISALKALSTYKPVSNVFTNNEILGNIKLDYVNDYTEQQTENAYVLLKCWNANIMPYVCHSNYIDIPDEKDKVFIWMRRKNNLFDLKIENLGDYNEDDKPIDTTKPIVTLEINPNNIEANRIPVTAYSIDDNGLKTVRFSKDNGNSWDEIVTVDGLSSTNSYTFINLNPNTTYTIRVEAIDLSGNIGGISQQVTTKS